MLQSVPVQSVGLALCWEVEDVEVALFPVPNAVLLTSFLGTGCKNGLQLVSGKCVSCPVNCLTCNDQLVCQNCSAGYYAKEGKCVLNCQMPCATCVDNLPNACLSCFGTANLVGSTCQFNSSCNATGSCISCGESSVSNLYYQNGKCYPCSKITIIPNCLQCSK